MIPEVFYNLLKTGYKVKTRAGGNSMFPFIKDNTWIEITPLPRKKIKKGDVVVFRSNQKILAHRLIQIDKTNDIYLTRGDFCQKMDNPLSRSEILGKVIKVHKKYRIVNHLNPVNQLINYIIAQMSYYSVLRVLLLLPQKLSRKLFAIYNWLFSIHPG